MPLSDPTQARALARSLIADARLYQGTALEEARTLYLSRVTPDLAALFDAELASPPAPRPGSGPLGRVLALALPVVVAVMVGHWAWRTWGGRSLLVVSEPPLGPPVERALSVSDGIVRVVLRAGEARAGGSNALYLEMSLLRAGAVVASTTCEPYSARRRTTESGVLGAASGCSLPVPAGGVDAVRLALRLREPGVPVAFSALELEVRRTPF